MPIRQRRPLRRAAYALVSIAAITAALLVPAFAGGTEREEAEAWKSAFEPRPRASSAERMIVVLTAPSLADQVATATEAVSPEQQREWTTAALAAQRSLVRSLKDAGVNITRDHAFARSVNAFSAVLGPEAIAALEASPLVAGLHPVRTVHPASLTAEALARASATGGLGTVDELRVPGLDGAGVTIALLDTGVDLEHPALAGRVLPGHDLLGKRPDARAARNPDNRSELEQHGTQMAALLVGAAPDGTDLGLAPAASVLPMRIMGWQPTDDGTMAVFGRGDQLLAGIERALDPDGDGAIDDRVDLIAAPVVQPFAAFAESPEARAVSGALALGALVVAPTGNDGPAHAGSATVGAPASSVDALAVAAADLRALLPTAQVSISVADATVFDQVVPLLSPASPVGRSAYEVGVLAGPSLADPERAAASVVTGARMGDFFAPDATSRVAGKAALLPADGSSAVVAAKNAIEAGAAAVLLYGSALPGGSLSLDPELGMPILSLPAGMGAAVADAMTAGQPATVEIVVTSPETNVDLERVAAFTSRGVTPAGTVRPDVSAPGVALPTAAAGPDDAGLPRYATVNGSSAASALAAGAAALVLQARPGLDAATLKAALIGSARALVAASEFPSAVSQGAGLVNPARAAKSRITVDPPVLSLGRPTRADWASEVSMTVTNMSGEPQLLSFGMVPDGDGTLPLDFAIEPASVLLPAGEARAVTLDVRVAAPAETWNGWVSGTLVVTPANGEQVRVPWATAFVEPDPEDLVSASRVSPATFATSESSLAAVLTFRAGALERHDDGLAVTPLGQLQLELWKGDELLGVLTTLRDLLPGRYTVGLSGLGPDGEPLSPGTYRLRYVVRSATATDDSETVIVGPSFTVTAQAGVALTWGGESFGPDDRGRFERWLSGRGLDYDAWRVKHPTPACDVFGDCRALAAG